jgi:excisionase family DNA binding protein
MAQYQPEVNDVGGGSMKKTERATFKVAEAAKFAGVGTSAIRKGVSAGTIPHIRFGRNILIPKDAFGRWLDSCGGQFTGKPERVSA